GAVPLRVPEAAGGLGVGLLDALVLMEEVGRTLASGPIAEAIIAAGLLARFGAGAPPDAGGLLGRVLAGKAVISIAYHDVAVEPLQWIAGGAVADAVLAREGDKIVLITIPPVDRNAEPNLASTPIAQVRLGTAARSVLSS